MEEDVGRMPTLLEGGEAAGIGLPTRSGLAALSAVTAAGVFATARTHAEPAPALVGADPECPVLVGVCFGSIPVIFRGPGQIDNERIVIGRIKPEGAVR